MKKHFSPNDKMERIGKMTGKCFCSQIAGFISDKDPAMVYLLKMEGTQLLFSMSIECSGIQFVDLGDDCCYMIRGIGSNTYINVKQASRSVQKYRHNDGIAYTFCASGMEYWLLLNKS